MILIQSYPHRGFEMHTEEKKASRFVMFSAKTAALTASMARCQVTDEQLQPEGKHRLKCKNRQSS